MSLNMEMLEKHIYILSLEHYHNAVTTQLIKNNILNPSAEYNKHDNPNSPNNPDNSDNPDNPDNPDNIMHCDNIKKAYRLNLMKIINNEMDKYKKLQLKK